MDDDIMNWRKEFYFSMSEVLDFSKLQTPSSYVVQPSFRRPVVSYDSKYRTTGMLGSTPDTGITGTYSWDTDIFGSFATKGSIKYEPRRPHWTFTFDDGKELHSHGRSGSLISGYRQRHAKGPIPLESLIKRELTRLGHYRDKTMKDYQRFQKRQAEKQSKFVSWKSNQLRRLQLKMDKLIARQLMNTDRYSALELEYSRILAMKFEWRKFRIRPYAPKWVNLVQGTAVQEAVVPTSFPEIVPLPVFHWKNKWTKAIGVIGVDVSGSGLRNVVEVFRESYTLSGNIPVTLCCQAPDLISLGGSSFREDNTIPNFSREKLGHAVRSMIPSVKKIVDLPVFIFELQDIKRSIDTLREAHRGFLKMLKRKGPVSQLLKLASGLDLGRKFGVDPTIRDSLKLIQETVMKVGDLDRQLNRLIADQGRLRRYNRIFDEETRTYEEDINWKQLILGSVPEQAFTARTDEHLCVLSDSECLNALRYTLDERVLKGMDDKVTIIVTERTVWRVTAHLSYRLVDLSGRDLSDDEIRAKVMLDRFGLGCNPKALWDIVPFSFVVDWLYNVGDVVDHYLGIKAIRPEVAIHNVVLSKKTTRLVTLPSQTIRRFYDIPEMVGSESTGGYQRCAAKFIIPHLENIQRDYRRWLVPAGEVITTYQLPVLGPPRWENAFTGIELLLSNL